MTLRHFLHLLSYTFVLDKQLKLELFHFYQLALHCSEKKIDTFYFTYISTCVSTAYSNFWALSRA